ncbi:GGDEF domain-containing protein [Candidatus Nitrotoga sp. 1052]|uniref:GGDEF domain-containing protein n=1 Tax=Candidatus Nitrotoga sp. 1052 TaxID=2886964 RepID=UPI001EF4D482|nr:GGDEF domain-containing protein [Candidatus Nitrotoga sp. 1052]CAH1081065.1 Diguanylate cyclase (GGDEF) domain-containing protein [Candidatus Nitrotoga sp. 1052]
MKKVRIPNFLLGTIWTGWRLWIVWSICVSVFLLIIAFRIATDAEFNFASLAVLPVLVITWIGGKRNGLSMAFLASAMWLVGDIASERQYSAQWIPWVNALTHLMTYSLVALLATQVRLQFEREHERATRDALTGLHNRRAFLEAGTSEVERTKRYAHPLAVIILDLDDFKQLNDTKGHDAGDMALRATAGALRGASRSSDRVARLGGDEFAVLLLEIGYEAAVEAGRKISIAVNAALQDFPPVRGSIGIAWFGEADRLFPAMLKAADELMYEVKKSGKDDVLSRRFPEINRSDTER